MIMDSYYTWNQPEHCGQAHTIWSNVLNDTLKEKIINQSQANSYFFNNQNENPIYSVLSQNIRDSWRNTPMRIEDYDLTLNGKDEKHTLKNKGPFINQFVQSVKKKRDYNKGSTYGIQIQIRYGMISTHSNDLYPWNVDKKVYSKNIDGLHEEVLDFYRYIMPSSEEQLMRQEVIARLKKVVRNEWPEAEVDVFGSFKTELHLPTSDIDVVIFGKWENPLWKLHDIIKRSGIASDCKVLDKATVPIVKMTDKESDVRIDISFNMSNGIKSAELIKSYIKQYPQLPQLVLLLKQYLLQRDLNEVWTGGISSYSLILMCVSFLKDCTSKDLDISGNLGYTLISFLEMYGRNFDYSNTGIRTVGDISYVAKEEIMKNMDCTQWSSILCIEDPLNPGNDIGRSSYGALHVKLAFEYAYSNLKRVVLSQSAQLYEDQRSILGRIIRITPEVIRYRAFIKTKYSTPRVLESAEVKSQSCPITKDTNTNNNSNNQKSKHSICEKGDVPNNKHDITFQSSNQIKPNKTLSNINYKKKLLDNLDSRPGQVRVPTPNNGHNNRNNNSPTIALNNKITMTQVQSKQSKKNKSSVIVNFASSNCDQSNLTVPRFAEENNL